MKRARPDHAHPPRGGLGRCCHAPQPLEKTSKRPGSTRQKKAENRKDRNPCTQGRVVYETNDDQASNHVNQKQNQERLSPASISRDPHRPRSDESPGAENCAHTAQCEHGKSRKDPRCLRKGKTGDSVQRNRQKRQQCGCEPHGVSERQME
jgi:hypothetical protein